jgi:DNA-directed RNA polymerase specialized sigma24 family protein
MVPDDSVTQWIAQLRTGDDAAAGKLWERYFRRLAGLARKRLLDVPRLPADGEDVALSAFYSLCAGLEQGRFPDLADRDSLWRLLVTITARKARQVVRDECRQKRGGGQCGGGQVGDNPDEANGLEHLLSREPTPEFAAEVAEQCRFLLSKLADEELRAIALWKMEGIDSEQIAARLGKALRTVERRLQLIRTLWSKEAAL